MSRPREVCTSLIEFSTVTNCSPPAWWSRSVRPRVGRISARLSADGVRPVELGGDVGGQAAAPHGLLGDRACRGRPETKLPRDAEEDLDPALPHRLDRVHRVQAVGARRVEAELVAQGVQEGVRHLLPDAHRAVALHVAVAAHGAGAGSGPAEVAAQQQEVDDLPDGGHAVLVLGDAHGPADDDPLAAQHLVADPLDLFAGQTGGGDHVVPADLPGVLGELLEAAGAVADEGVVQDRAGPGVLGLQEQPVQRLEQGEVAAGPDVQETGRRSGRARPITPRAFCGFLNRSSPASGSGLTATTRAPLRLGLFQCGQLPRVVGAGVLAHQEDQVGVVEIVEA
ncbi:hypothetical protein STENM327S_06075 [Streptomyces tendae]